MTPFEHTTENIVTSGTNQIVAVPCPGRCIIDRIAITQAAAGAFTADFYNRAFTNTAQVVRKLVNDGNGKCLLSFPLVFTVRLGDIVTVTLATNAAYNADHRVTKIIDDKTIVTDQAYTVDDYTAKGQINIPAAEQALYKAVAQLSGSGGFGEVSPAAAYVNQDPQPNLTNRGYPRLLYVKISAVGTYRISIRARQSVAQGD